MIVVDCKKDITTASYIPKTPDMPHQAVAKAHWGKKHAFALFMDKGTGKTKTAIDKAGELFISGEITGVLVVSLKSLHRQWSVVQIPKHLGCEFVADYWQNKPMSEAIMHPSNKLAWLSTYIQALLVDRHFEMCCRFIEQHNGKVLMIVDESSHSIKNRSSQQSQRASQLGQRCKYRAILSGDPRPKSPLDIWSQFMFLDERIIGFRYKTAFMNRYCVLGGFKGKEIVGEKNSSELTQKISNYAFTIRKEDCLDLPPKVYDEWSFPLHDSVKPYLKQMKRDFLIKLSNGAFASAANAAVMLIRVQQLTCGKIVRDDGVIERVHNSRLEALKELLATINSKKIVIWAHFNDDIVDIMQFLGSEQAVSYWGGTSQKDREIAKELFATSSSIRYFVGSPASGGVGLDGLQGECDTVIYYTNSDNALHRWQSEDRTHRIGTFKTVTYYDLICENSVDRRIIAALKRKQSLQELTLSEIRSAINEL